MQIVTVAFAAAGHREIAVQFTDGKHRPIARWNRVEQHGRIEHMVVQAEIVARHDVGAGLRRQFPVPFAQHAGGVEQGFGAAVGAPMGFERSLEFALEADAWEA